MKIRITSRLFHAQESPGTLRLSAIVLAKWGDEEAVPALSQEAALPGVV